MRADAMAADLGSHLKAARKEHGWSLREAERRSGVPNAHISQIETGGIRQPGTPVLIRLATAYEIPLADLLALAGHASFGTLDENGRLTGNRERYDMWTIAAWLPRGREAEAAEWMAAHGIEVYRMWQPTAATAAPPPDSPAKT
jgi:transcriptional regulator with XRE-family HTH domain